MTKFSSLLIALLVFTACQKGDSNTASTESSISSINAQTTDFDPLKRAYFGDLHVHTSWSFDAFIYNVRTTPDDAYRYGKGEAIEHVSGKKIQAKRPLDFMAVTDHAEYMGVMKKMIDPDHPLSKLQVSDSIRNTDPNVSRAAFGSIGQSLARSQPRKELIDKKLISDTWDQMVKTTNAHYEPGKFTTFHGYEWTSAPAVIAKDPYAYNLHRNVIYGSDQASTIPFSAFDSQDPEELWKWMEKEREKGIKLMAIPHNANMSDGNMYKLESFTGKPLTKAYAESRSRNEPINEVSQIKGTSMTHPALSPNDEFADFEIYAFTFSAGAPPPSKPQHSYVRQAIKNGLALEQEIGANPFQFGFIGSSDSHNASNPVEEDNFTGKIGVVDGTPKIRSANPDAVFRTRYWSAAGLACVWAEENTRESIFAAMERREVYATSGTRMQIRFFAGDYPKNLFEGSDWLSTAYSNGQPMGSHLGESKTAPQFAVWAAKDPEGANLDRIQIIKTWVDGSGEAQEKVFEVVWAGDRQLDTQDKLAAIGNTVDVEAASYTNSIGAVSLQSTWQDPEFEAGQSAAYYVRVLEIPTPRWSTHDAKALSMKTSTQVPESIQERGWSSPIWVK